MTFRSLPMSHYMLIISKDNAYETMNHLARLEAVHLQDTSHLSDRPYTQSVRRCQQCAQHLGMIRSSLSEHKKSYMQYVQTEKKFTEKLFEIWQKQAHEHNISQVKLIDIYQSQINEQYERYHLLTQRIQKLKTKKQQIVQKLACWEVVQDFFGESKSLPSIANTDFLIDHENLALSHLSGINYLIGVIPFEAQLRFDRMIYRVSRGFACTRSVDSFQYEGLSSFGQKVVLVLFPSSQNKILEKKIFRVMQTFCNNIVDIDQKEKSSSQLKLLKTQYEEIENLIKISEKDLDNFLEKIIGIQYLEKWSLFIWKQKYIYEQLNKLEVRGQFMFASIYIPEIELEKVTHSLNSITPVPSIQPLPSSQPPTAFDTNCYTIISQQITDTYGVPRYQEINPTIFTTVTFPFFFGVMFGDIGHGACLLALGIFLVWKNDWFLKNNMKAISDLRYMVVMMGFFAFYCGFIYNDIIGFNYNIFGSCYDPVPPKDYTFGDYRPSQKDGCVYPFGLDPIWGKAENELVFINGLKMKLSVIIGVFHMIVGIIVKAFNARYFRKNLDFYFEFIPQIIFMVLLFGYMDFLIIFKWLKVWDEHVDNIPPVQWAPSIISTMMNIGLKMGETGIKPDGNSNMWGERGNSSQDSIQFMILVIAFLCIPIMLLPKPILMISAIKKKKKNLNPLLEERFSQVPESQKSLHTSLITTNSGRRSEGPMIAEEFLEDQDNGHEGSEDSGEIFVHQLIETIEFVLGAVSNTASYLRLWALSLAHSQLAKVFFQKTLLNGIQMDSVIFAVPSMLIFFFALCWITFGVLMCMDSMECFLHSLRLHWVEFQNKFYKGDGYRYEPISVAQTIVTKKAEIKS